MSLQVVLVVLLLVAIGWSAMLHRRLAALRQGGDGIGKFVSDLVSATGRAELATRQMREVSADLARQWQRQRAEGDGMTADLRRLSGDAQAVLRDFRSLPPVSPLRHTLPDEPDGVATRVPAARAAGAAGPATVEGPSQHDRIRQAIRDLR